MIWVFGWVFPMGSFGGVGVVTWVVVIWVFGWHRGVCMVRKWKW